MRYLRLVVVAVSLLFVLPYAVQAAPPIIATSVVAGCNGNVATLTVTLNGLTYSYYGSSGLYYHFDPPSIGTTAGSGNPTVLTLPPLTPGPHTVVITTSSAWPGGSQSSIYSFIVPNCGAACAPPPNTTMVAWYPFDELVGPTAANLATGNTGAHTGGPTPVPGIVAGALSFNGTSAYVKSVSTIVTNFGPANTSAFCGSGSQGGYSACLGNFSIDAWVRIQSNAPTGVMVIVDKRSSNPIKGYSFFVVSQGPFQRKLGLQLADGIGTQFSNFLSPTVPSLYDGNWHHIAVTVNRLLSTGIRWYYDGAPVIGPSGNPMGRQGSLVNTSALHIGTRTAASALTGWFQGDMDELEIFNRVLTAPEVSSIHGALSSGKCK